MNASQRHLYLILAGTVAAACSSDVTEIPNPANTASGGSTASGMGGAGGTTTIATNTTVTTTTGFVPDGGFETDVCFDWPPQNTGGGGAGGTAGAPPSPDDPCPTGYDALAYVPQNRIVCGSASVVAEGPHSSEQCCYTLYEECGVGRPFLDASGAAVTAEPARSRHWTGGTVAVGDATDQERALLAERWQRDALLEHASVASFGRFALELLAVGAPASLLTGAHEAAIDEVRHAERCFDLARAYGAEVDPGPMPMGDFEVSADLADIAARTVIEGCVGETLAAVLAAEQRRGATVPDVEATLAMIARDEAKHADLAWRAVAWMVQRGGEPVRAAVEAAFAEAQAHHEDAVPTDREAIEAHGLLSARDEHALVRSTLATVIAPLARELTA